MFFPYSSEREAKESCAWLRAAGFPQYAQLYEDGANKGDVHLFFYMLSENVSNIFQSQMFVAVEISTSFLVDYQFSIDIAAVKKDHDFLDKDLVETLCRRLNTLNKCASMKLDLNFQRKKASIRIHIFLCK
ncbi:hypothetical protein Chor_000282 [Crotalus horridus]